MEPKLMESRLEYLLSSVGICVKSCDGTVTYQNRLCARVCGNQLSRACAKACASLNPGIGGLPFVEEGAHLFKSRAIGDESFDMVLINDRRAITTIFYPLQRREAEQFRFLEGHGLTRREREVMSLVIRMESNAAISRKLFISMATLKTHLNNIYKKLPGGSSLDIRRKRASTFP